MVEDKRSFSRSAEEYLIMNEVEDLSGKDFFVFDSEYDISIDDVF